MKNFKEKLNSDTAAVGTVEIIILIALAVFAALAVFTFVLKPTQGSADKLGQGIDAGIGKILSSGGKTEGVTEAFGSGKVTGTP